MSPLTIPCFFTLGAFLLTLQTTLFQVLPEWAGKPDLLFVLVVFLAINMETFHGAILALLFGLVMDIFSGIFLGLYPVVYLGLYFLLRTLSAHLAIREPAHYWVLVPACYLAANVGIYIFSAILSPQAPPDWSWAALILQMIILAVISLPLFSLFERIVVSLSPKSSRLAFQQSTIKKHFRN